MPKTKVSPFSDEALIEAASNGNAALIEEYLKTTKNPNPNLFHIAAKNNQTNILKLFLQNKKFDINCLDANNKTALYRAAENNAADATMLLTSIGARVDEPNLLEIAIINDHPEIVKILLSRDATLSAKEPKSLNNLFCFAANVGALKVVESLDYSDLKLFKQMIAEVDLSFPILLKLAIKANRLEIVKILVEEKKAKSFDCQQGIIQNVFDNDPLILAIKNPETSPEIVKFLADKNRHLIDPSTKLGKDYAIALRESLIESSRTDLVDFLIKKEGQNGIDLSSYKALHLCFNRLGIISNPSYKKKLSQSQLAQLKEKMENFIIKILQPKTEETKNILLELIKHQPSEKLLDEFLKKGYDVNEKSDAGHTALMLCEDAQSATNLIKRGAAFDITSPDGKSFIHLAANLKNAEVVLKILHERGVNFNLQTVKPKNLNSNLIYGQTALHHAAINGDIKIIQTLIELGADLGIKDDKGKTAKDLALQHCHPQAAEALLTTKLTIDIRTAQEKFKYIKKYPRQKEVEDFLQSYLESLNNFCSDFYCSVIPELMTNPISLINAQGARTYSDNTCARLINNLDPMRQEILHRVEDKNIKEFTQFFRNILLQTQIFQLYSKVYYEEENTELLAKNMQFVDEDFLMQFSKLVEEKPNPADLLEKLRASIKELPSSLLFDGKLMNNPYINIESGVTVESPQNPEGFARNYTLNDFIEKYKNLLKELKEKDPALNEQPSASAGSPRVLQTLDPKQGGEVVKK